MQTTLSEVQNRRRSQNGLIIQLNGAPVMTLCQSKASSVTFASPRIGEARADMSSGAVEIYALGNATLDIMGLSYDIVVVWGNGNELPLPLHTGNGR